MELVLVLPFVLIPIVFVLPFVLLAIEMKRPHLTKIVAWGGMGILLWLLFFVDAAYDFLYLTQGITVQGTVTSHKRIPGSGVCDDLPCGDTFETFYSWEIDGQTFSAKDDSGEIYDKYQDGNSISLVYLANAPDIVYRRETLAKSGVVSAAIAAAITIVTIGGLVVSRRKKKLGSNQSTQYVTIGDKQPDHSA
jgi:hypothetical protein